MKVVVLYGPPAVGKLTVAKKLSEITGYKLFHNHLIGDLVNSLFEFNSKEFKKYSMSFRLDLIDAFSKTKEKGLIITFMKGDKEGEDFLKKIEKIVKKNKGKIFFVHLVCEKKELGKRVTNKSRKKFTKVNNKKDLNYSLNRWDFYKEISFAKSMQIDNSKISAKKVAERIKEEISL